jgi:glyoxylase-like metal-dependent hydrolase (beta-lactamase superfamily II)
VQEIAPGLWHWRARHPRLRADVSSYYLERERVAIDALLPGEGLEWLQEHGPPEHVVLSNRHHDRDAWRLREAFGATVHCIRNGLYELQGRGPAEAFDFGDELAGGIVVYEVDSICPDETALHIPAHRALACADGVVGSSTGLAFVPDYLMDFPEQTKRGLIEAYERLLDLDFELLLLAHGNPVIEGGNDALREFVSD